MTSVRAAGPGPGSAAADGAPQPGAGPAPHPATGPEMAGARGQWRRWRAVLAVSVIVLLGGIVVALLTPGTAPAYLNPAQTGPEGSHALAAILAGRGHPVFAVGTPAAARDAARSGGGTLVITSPVFLTRHQLDGLARTPADLVIIEPDAVTLAALAPGVTLAGPPAAVGPRQPGCALADARLAGSADLGGIGVRLPAGLRGAVSCYRAAGHPLLVRYSSGGRVITILGSGAFLTNALLAYDGNAALALNLLTARSRIIWLTPPPAATAAAGPLAGPRSLFSLIPLGAYLVVIQLAIGAILAALWRTRRLGALVSEQLPVVVRASETVEGHGRLYQARRARQRAAAELREAMLGRVLAGAGLHRRTPAATVTSALAARTRISGQDIEARLFGPGPPSDRELVMLADDLDALEREVRAGEPA